MILDNWDKQMELIENSIRLAKQYLARLNTCAASTMSFSS